MSIQSEINRLNAAKAELKTSIENGGVTVSLDAKIDAYPALVDAITQQVKDKVDAINGEVVEGDVDAKLNKITSTKTDLAAALAEKGQTVGDVFADYPAAVRAIETGSPKEYVNITFSGSNAQGQYGFIIKTESGWQDLSFGYFGDRTALVEKGSPIYAYIPQGQLLTSDFDVLEGVIIAAYTSLGGPNAGESEYIAFAFSDGTIESYFAIQGGGGGGVG